MIVNWKGSALIVRHFRFHNVPVRLGYSAFVPLDAGESFTYIIEVRAVEEKLSYIGATGYFSNSRLNVWLDDWETLTNQDHRERVGQMVFALSIHPCRDNRVDADRRAPQRSKAPKKRRRAAG